jgi:hypothetical protein
MNTTHQEYSDLTVTSFNPNLGATAPWDFLLDLANFGESPTDTSLTGVLWGSVRSFNPTGGETQPGTNLPENYLPATVAQTAPPNFSNPRIVNPFPDCEACTVQPGQWVINNQGDPSWIITLQGAPPIVQSIGNGSQIITGRLDPGTVAMLNNVAAGTSNALVGDDIVAGVPFHAVALPVVIVAAGTLQVQGVFQVSSTGALSSIAASSGRTFADPPDLRSYDAADAVLRSLHVASGGATITSVDVRAALAGNQSEVLTAVAGAAPVQPLAMSWSGAESSLYVVDAAPGNGDRRALRLVRINRDSVAEELWRLEPDVLPQAALLSTSRQNEHVLTIVHDDRTEIATFDISGEPIRSLSVHGKPVVAPIATDSGFSLPLRRKVSAHPENALLDLRFFARHEAEPLLCGAQWLRQHVVPGGILGDPRKDCAGQQDQDHHGR